MRRSPVSVSISSTAPMCFDPPAISFARPPVATVFVSGPSLGDHAFEDAVYQADVAVIEADLDVVDRPCSDDLRGFLDIHAGKPRRSREQRIC